MVLAGILTFPEKENHGKPWKFREMGFGLFSGKPRKSRKTTEMNLAVCQENHGNQEKNMETDLNCLQEISQIRKTTEMVAL